MKRLVMFVATAAVTWGWLELAQQLFEFVNPWLGIIVYVAGALGVIWGITKLKKHNKKR